MVKWFANAVYMRGLHKSRIQSLSRVDHEERRLRSESKQQLRTWLSTKQAGKGVETIVYLYDYCKCNLKNCNDAAAIGIEAPMEFAFCSAFSCYHIFQSARYFSIHGRL